MTKPTTCTPLHVSLLLNIHCSPVPWGHHRSQPAGEYIRELEAWGMCERSHTHEQHLTDKGRAWMNSMLIVPQDDQGDSEVTNQTWVPEVGEQCEYYYSEGKEWRKGEVVAFYKGAAILIDVQDGLAVNGDIVRKLNTDEDKAVEEMMDIVIAADARDAPDVCRVLHEAGYRKQEAQPDMSDPANWRAGDVVKCVDLGPIEEARYDDQWENGTLGAFYRLTSDGIDEDGDIRIIDDDNEKGCPHSKHFRFHSRP